MANITSYIVDPRSFYNLLHSYDIEPESFRVSVLDNGNKSFIVIDRENDRVFTCSAQDGREAVKSYIDWIYGEVKAEDEDGLISYVWAGKCVHVVPSCVEEWELVEER